METLVIDDSGINSALHKWRHKFSGPCCDSDIEIDQYKSFVWESHVRQQLFVVFEDFIVKSNKIQLGFDNISWK